MIKVGSTSADGWLNASQAAAVLGVKTETVYVYASRGLLPSVRRGRARVYKKSDVERHALRARARAGDVAASALGYGAPVLDSAITVLDPQSGPRYRGRDAVSLAAGGARFEQVADLLWGADPSSAPWTALPRDDLFGVAPTALPKVKDQPPVAGLDALFFALGTQRSPVVIDPVGERARARRLAGRAAASLALPRGVEAAVVAAQEDRIASAALVALGARATPQRVALVDTMLVLIADHELTPSTFCARIAASTGADLVGCLQAARAAHAGPRHGGACDRIEELLTALSARGGGAAAARDIVAEQFQRGARVPGFFRDLYPRGDPRAAALLSHPVVARHPVRGQVSTLAAAHARVTDDDTPPSVDTALVAACTALALPSGSATALFALGRSAGWIAHVIEQRESAQVLRPRARAPQRA